MTKENNLPLEAEVTFIPAFLRENLPQDQVDAVNHPPHYLMGGIETIDFIEAKGLGYNLGNVVKYITRADHKGDKLQDLEKARWYLDRAIDNAYSDHADQIADEVNRSDVSQ
jgi:hypothetical protein